MGDAQPVLVADPVSNGKRGQKAVKKTVRKTTKTATAKTKTGRDLAARAS